MKRCLVVLYASLFIVMIGFGLILPVLPFYIERMALAQNGALQVAPVHVGALTGVFALMQFFFAPLWGRFSDRRGKRRPFLIIGLAGNALALLFFGIATNLVMLYAARILNGIFAAAVLPIASAYVADVTSEKMRARGMAWLGTAIGLGIVAGPALGGVLSRLNWNVAYRFGPYAVDSFSIPFFVAALLSLLTLFIVWKWLPESLLAPCSEHASRTKANRSAQQSRPEWQIWKAPSMKWLALSFLAQFSLALFEGTFALHAKQELRFGPAEMAAVFMVCGLVMALVQGTTVGWLIERIGAETLLPVGFALVGLALLLFMVASSITEILLYVGIFALGMALLMPSIIVLVTRHEQKYLGSVLGLQSSANSLGQASGPLIGGILFVWQAHLPYISTALLVIAVAAWMTWSLLRDRAQAPQKVGKDHPD